MCWCFFVFPSVCNIHSLEASDEFFSDRMNKAITYAVNQEEHLRRFLANGNIFIDNGHVERVIRSYSVGRSNWLFADTAFGAEVNALNDYDLCSPN